MISLYFAIFALALGCISLGFAIGQRGAGAPTIEESVEDVINECYHDRYSLHENETSGTANMCNNIMDMLNKLCKQTDGKIFSKCDSKLLSKYIADENL